MAHLSVNKTKTIMQTLDGTDAISKDAVLLVTRAAELFIKELAGASYENTKGGRKVSYENLVQVVHSNSQYEFLECMIPKKITVREYKELMRKKNLQQSDEEEENSSEESSSASESDNS